MRKIIKAAIIMLSVGVLLGGIGTGVAIAEYTSIEYTGEHFLGAENMTTKTMEVFVEPEEGKKIRITSYRMLNGIEYKEVIPMNTIRYVITYNPELLTPCIRYKAYESSSNDDYQGYVYMDSNHHGSEVDLFMKHKDKILEELKQGKIGTYQMIDIESIEIWVNPGMKGLVDF